MKILDRSRHYGVIYGGEAKFVQDGVEFDARGHEISATAQAAATDQAAEDRAQGDAEGVVAKVQTQVKCQEFLTKILAGGPVLKSNIYRESQDAGLVWVDVKTACADMNLRIQTRKGQEFWQLTETQLV